MLALDNLDKLKTIKAAGLNKAKENFDFCPVHFLPLHGHCRRTARFLILVCPNANEWIHRSNLSILSISPLPKSDWMNECSKCLQMDPGPCSFRVSNLKALNYISRTEKKERKSIRPAGRFGLVLWCDDTASAAVGYMDDDGARRPDKLHLANVECTWTNGHLTRLPERRRRIIIIIAAWTMTRPSPWLPPTWANTFGVCAVTMQMQLCSLEHTNYHLNDRKLVNLCSPFQCQSGLALDPGVWSLQAAAGGGQI